VDERALQAFGLEDTTITTHEVLLPWPEEVSVEMTEPKSGVHRCAKNPFRAIRTQIRRPTRVCPITRLASGEVTAPVVYVGSGNPADYDGWPLER
jgi:hypothetical protein